MNNKAIIRVRDVMKDDFITMDGLATVQEGIDVLKQKKGAHTMIINKRDNDDEYGIVVLADIAKKILVKNKSPERVNLYEIMTKPVLGIDPEMNIRYCAKFFYRFGLSTAPVIQNRKIMGVVSYNDIVMHRLDGE